MTLLKAIARADSVRPNALDQELKADWVMELEAEIAECMDVELPENTFPKDMELLMPYPHDNIYYLYLCAKIDLTMEDTQSYVNDQVVADSAIVDAKSWWRRHNIKKCNQYTRAFPWQAPIPIKEKEEEDVTEDTDTDTTETVTDVPTQGD